jgi:hypothetical protein
MPQRTSKTGSELFIVDNSDEDWKALRYVHDWCQISKSIEPGHPSGVAANLMRDTLTRGSAALHPGRISDPPVEAASIGPPALESPYLARVPALALRPPGTGPELLVPLA